MTDRRGEGLGLSIVVYAALMVGGLALFVAPVVWAYGPTEYPNPDLPKYDITSSRPISDQHRARPLAYLKRDDIIDQKTIAALNAKPDKPAREQTASTSRAARTAFAQAPEHDEPERPRRSFFGFSLF